MVRDLIHLPEPLAADIEWLAGELGDEFVSTEVLLAAIAGSKTDAAELLTGRGATYDAIKGAFPSVRGAAKVTSENPEDQFQALEKYATDLTARAREGKIDPVIGRDQEIRRVVQVLSRRTKNNPVLIGEPGVGKTAIVEGLARRIVEGFRRTRFGKEVSDEEVKSALAEEITAILAPVATP